MPHKMEIIPGPFLIEVRSLHQMECQNISSWFFGGTRILLRGKRVVEFGNPNLV